MPGPIANYKFGPNPKVIGFNAVGPGWKRILEALDSFMEARIADARNHGSGVVKEKYRDPDCEADADIVILQIKEKFGGLRVYWQGKGLGHRVWNQVAGAVALAETVADSTCEKCGAPGEKHGSSMMRPQQGWRFGRTLTLCEPHREEREVLRSKGRSFEIGNGDEV